MKNRPSEKEMELEVSATQHDQRQKHPLKEKCKVIPVIQGWFGVIVDNIEDTFDIELGVIRGTELGEKHETTFCSNL